MFILVVHLPVVVHKGRPHPIPTHNGRILFLIRIISDYVLADRADFTENSRSTKGPFSAMVRSLLVLNRSDGSTIIAFFFELTEADGLLFSFEKVTVMPTGI